MTVLTGFLNAVRVALATDRQSAYCSIPVARCQGLSTHNWHTGLSHNPVFRSDRERSFALPTSPFLDHLREATKAGVRSLGTRKRTKFPIFNWSRLRFRLPE